MYTCRLILLFSFLSYTEVEDVAETCFQKFQVKLDCQKGDLNILTVSGFSTEEQAIDFLDKLNTAFHWLMLDRGIVVEAALARDQIQCHSNVKHGCNFNSIDGRPSTHIFEVPSPFIHTKFGKAGSIVGASIVLDGLRAGLDIATRIIPELDDRLSLALDLFRSSTRQECLKARFTMLITSMECLTNEETRDDWQIHLIDKFIGEVNACNPATESADLHDELQAKKDSMIGALKSLKYKSKLQLVKKEIRRIYEDKEDYKRIKAMVKELFQKRHRIVHLGENVSQEQVESLESIQKDLLIHRITSLPKRQLFEDMF